MIRRLWLSLVLALATVLFGGLALAGGVVSGRWARAMSRPWALTALWAARIRVRVEHAERLPSRPGVMVCNHVSSADIGAVLAAFSLDLCWVAKSAYVKVPFFGWVLKRSHITVTRAGGGAAQLLRVGRRRLAQGAWVMVFPEGTRRREGGEMLPFKTGAFRLAQAAGCPVVPVAIRGTDRLWPPSQPIPSPGEAVLRVGRPLDPARFPADDPEPLARAARQELAALLAD
jgi:1-acyl-sn-glycerol-3-phosphate acyltransferase